MPLDAIGQVIQQLEQQPNWRSRGEFRRVLGSWSSLVGEVVARQARPVRLSRRILYVAVANPMWAQTLTLERLTLLHKLNQHLQLDLTDLRFSSGDWLPRSATTPAPPGNPALPAWLSQHPSFEAAALEPSRRAEEQLTVVESFQRWAHLAQQLGAQRALCPDCRCPCPVGELNRWSRCSVCAAQQFGQPRANRPLG